VSDPSIIQPPIFTMDRPSTSRTSARDFATRRPLSFAIALTAAIVALETALAYLLGEAGMQDRPVAAGLIANGVLAAAAIASISLVSGWRDAGFREPTSWLSVLHCWPLLAYSLLVMLGAPEQAAPSLDLLALACLVGFQKEAFSRGLTLWALEPFGPRSGAILCAALYGAMHLGAVLYGADLFATALASLIMLFVGFAYAAIRLRIGTIWPLVALQALFYVGSFSHFTRTPDALPPADVLIASVAIAFALALYGWFVLPRARRESASVAVSPD
jgi:hypothetical protein